MQSSPPSANSRGYLMPTLPDPPLRSGDLEQDVDALYSWVLRARSIDAGGDPTSLDADDVEESSNADGTGAIPIFFRISVNAAGNVDVAMNHDIRVVLAWMVKTGADGTPGNTIQLQNGTNAITPAITLISGEDQSVGIFDFIDDAQHRIAAGDNLRVAVVDGGSGGDFNAEVYVIAVRVA